MLCRMYFFIYLVRMLKLVWRASLCLWESVCFFLRFSRSMFSFSFASSHKSAKSYSGRWYVKICRISISMVFDLSWLLKLLFFQCFFYYYAICFAFVLLLYFNFSDCVCVMYFFFLVLLQRSGVALWSFCYLLCHIHTERAQYLNLKTHVAF